MRQYELIFRAFGAKPLAQVAAAVVIGAIFGVMVVGRIPPEDQTPRGLFVAGGVGIGLFAGVALVYADARKRRAQAAAASGLPVKRLMNSIVLVVLLALGAIVLIVLVSLIATVYGHMT